MAFCPGNFLHGIAIKLHYSVFLISWAKRDNAIIRCCTKGRRDYSSSFPVKYIPKKSSEDQENGASPEKIHNGPELNLAKRLDFSNNSTSTFSVVNSKNHGLFRASDLSHGLNLVALNDEFTEETENIVEDGSKGGSGIQSSNSRQAVEKLAVELLASRSYTALELKKKLQAKKFAHEIVDEVITDFQSRGLINDCLYAETYSRSRWSSSSWGPRQIRQALSKKGISEADTQNAIKQVFESEDQDSGINMSKLSIDQLYVQASKQWQRSQASVEGRNQITTGELVSLYEQELVYCDTPYDQSCDGGLMDCTFQFIIKNREIETESDYLYSGIVKGNIEDKSGFCGITVEPFIRHHQERRDQHRVGLHVQWNR